jgi:hypothetical protein
MNDALAQRAKSRQLRAAVSTGAYGMPGVIMRTERLAMIQIVPATMMLKSRAEKSSSSRSSRLSLKPRCRKKTKVHQHLRQRKNTDQQHQRRPRYAQPPMHQRKRHHGEHQRQPKTPDIRAKLALLLLFQINLVRARVRRIGHVKPAR